MSINKFPKVSVIIPVYNEAEVLEQQLKFILQCIRKTIDSFEIIVIENGSIDSTKSILLKQSQVSSSINLIIQEIPDYGRAIREGILRASGEIIHICQIDFFDEQFFKVSLEHLAKGRVFVVGSRNRKGWDGRPIQRQILTFGLNFILRWFFSFKGTDTHGLKTFYKEEIIEYVCQCKMRRGVFDTEMVLRTQYAGVEIIEEPVRAYEIRKKRNSLFVMLYAISLLISTKN